MSENRLLRGPRKVLFGVKGQRADSIACLPDKVWPQNADALGTMLAWDKNQIDIPMEVIIALYAGQMSRLGHTEFFIMGKCGVAEKYLQAADWFMKQEMVLATQALKEKAANDQS